MQKNYDVAVIGAGPGGYVAAITAAQKNAKTILIEKQFIGGVCLNTGCMPTKALINCAATYSHAKQAATLGINIDNITINYETIYNRKNKIVANLKRGLEGLIKANKIDILHGEASFLSKNQLQVGADTIDAKKIIIATGSTEISCPTLSCDHKFIYNSASILNITELPKSLAIIGGGYIGSEFACFFAELGVNVTIIEQQDMILQSFGKDLANALKIELIKKGVKILTGTGATAVEGHKLYLSNNESLEVDKILVAIGRRPHTDNLNLSTAGVELDKKGFIAVNDKMETNIPDIYAIGDITGKHMLAHVASHEGIIAAQNALGKSQTMDYKAVPAIVFTHPECASVGITEEEATQEIITGTFPMQASGAAHTLSETAGFVKVIANKNTHQLLGAQVMGHGASLLIAELALAINKQLTLEDITKTIHAHPTLSETWSEAANLALKTPLHLPPHP